MMSDELKQIPIEHLQRGKYQPRRDFNSVLLQELADSIREQGVIEPIIVRPVDGRFEIIAGERRWRAAQLIGLNKVSCIVREYSDEQAAEVTLIENIQRENLNPIEEAQALQRLLDEFHYTHEEAAIALGKSRAKITNCLRLLHLDQRVQHLLMEKQLSEGHGKALASIPFSAQYPLAKQCIDNTWSVRRMEQEVKKVKSASQTHNNLDDPNITRLERRVSERFNAAVKVENNVHQKSGWIKVKYYDYDTLTGILEKMGLDQE
jgi:ParB family transcriptional regulator, chromosome partitioning protein